MIKDSLQKRPCKAQLNEKGFILVTVLLVIALLFPLVLAFNSKVQLNLTQAENFRNSIQAQRAARLGVIGAIGLLKQDSGATYDSKRSRWAMSFPSISISEGGILTVSIVDEDGKLPVNNLIVGSSQPPPAAGATPAPPVALVASAKTPSSTPATATAKAGEVNNDLVLQLRGLISQLGGKQEITDAVVDWLDDNDEVTGSEGAEEDHYKRLGHHCKNGPLDSADELLLMKGFDKELVIDKKLKDFVTAIPFTAEAQEYGKINVNTAPLEVLKVVLGTQTSQLAQPFSESDIEDLVRYRDEHDLKIVDDIVGAIKISSGQLGKAKSLLKVKSSYFTVSSRYTIGKVVKNVEALLHRVDSTVTIVSWREF